jgi:ATP-dependent DNA ligase
MITRVVCPRPDTSRGALDESRVRRRAEALDKISGSRHVRGVTLPRVEPIIPTWRKEPFDDPVWLFEFKYDGFRGLCYLEQGRCRFVSRNGKVLSRFEFEWKSPTGVGGSHLRN